MSPGPKHISELSQYVDGARRIGFKLETGVELNELLSRAEYQLEQYGVDATIANLLEEINNPDSPRAYMVTTDGVRPLESLSDMCEAILVLLTN